jgi:hypothetical protein
MGCYAVAAMLEEPPSVAAVTTSRARPIASMLLLYAVGRRQGRPVAVQVSSPASLAPRREPRRAKPVATKLRTRGDTRKPDQISITRRFGTNDE